MIRFALVLCLTLIGAGSAAADGRKPVDPNAKPNRLIEEASPYLRQHAYNPIDWYPWGEEAFAKARRENKPIFLSVGYATCHWCHVMARESFENKEIGKLLNDKVVAIKVDRERRPDVDYTYMLATELMIQRGGWPNSVFLTHDLKPFFAFGYVPADQFKGIVNQVADAWNTERDTIVADSERVAKAISAIQNRRLSATTIDKALLSRASLQSLSGFDSFNGGIGTAPKFPQENILRFWLHRAERDNDTTALEAARITLDHMVRGGINDHLAGGFHRYAVDNEWAVPHFEKMLYNQSQITLALIKGFQLTGDRSYAEAARRTLDFVLSVMTTPDGGFISALDADTNGEEGLYYLWTKAEIEKALGLDAALAIKVLGITENGNLEGRNTLRLTEPKEDLAAAVGMTVADLDAKLLSIFARLQAVRAKRTALNRDGKVLTGWNAMMIVALAEGAAAFDEPRYLKAALRAQRFLMDKLGGSGGELKRSFYEGKAELAATQADMALLALSAVALFDVTGEKRWLVEASRLAKLMVERFHDPASGLFFLTAGDAGFARSKQIDDGDQPSGNAAALLLFAKLSRRLQDPVWRLQGESLYAAVSGRAARLPASHAASLVAADTLLRGETGSRQALSKGAVRLLVKRAVSKDGKVPGTINLRVTLAPGWHINTDAPKQDFLIPTRVGIAGAKSARARFPAAVSRRLSSVHDGPLEVLEGDFDITVTVDPAESRAGSGTLEVALQACSDKLCLEPETARLLIPAMAH